MSAVRVPSPFGVLVVDPIPAGDPELDALHPEERSAAEALLLARRRAFVAGRRALRRALTDAGAPDGALLSDDRGAPVVPDGFSGSIAHKTTHAAAIAAPIARGRVGVDIEVEDRERWAIADRVLTPLERRACSSWIEVLARFSLKEAIYKSVDPWLRRYVAFREAEIPGLPLAGEDFVAVEGELRVPEARFTLELAWARSPKTADGAPRTVVAVARAVRLD